MVNNLTFFGGKVAGMKVNLAQTQEASVTEAVFLPWAHNPKQLLQAVDRERLQQSWQRSMET